MNTNAKKSPSTAGALLDSSRAHQRVGKPRHICVNPAPPPSEMYTVLSYLCGDLITSNYAWSQSLELFRGKHGPRGNVSVSLEPQKISRGNAIIGRFQKSQVFFLHHTGKRTATNGQMHNEANTRRFSKGMCRQQRGCLHRAVRLRPETTLRHVSIAVLLGVGLAPSALWSNRPFENRSRRCACNLV